MIRGFAPNNLEELYSVLENMTEKSKIVAGGTDLGIHLKKMTITPDALLYLGNIQETREIIETKNFIEIGACITHTELEESNIVKKYLSAISDAAKDVGSLQIRNNGTIGGNIANASPAADLLPVLFLLDSLVVVANKNKELKEIKIEDFILGPGKIALNPDEAILKFKIPKKNNMYSAFLKLGSRKKLTISRIGLSLKLMIEDGKINNVVFFIGAISLKPVKFEIPKEEISKIQTISKFLEQENKERIFNKIYNIIFQITPEKFDRNYKMWAAKAIVYDLFDILAIRLNNKDCK